jgi:hypothetical protein
MKKLVLLLLTVSCLALGMENDGLRHRGESAQQSPASNPKGSMQDEYIKANREMERAWAKKSKTTHLKECLKDSQLMLCMGFTNVVTAVALYAIYSYMQQV